MFKAGAKSLSKQRRFAHLLHVTQKTHGKYTSDFFKNAVKDMVLVHHTLKRTKSGRSLIRCRQPLPWTARKPLFHRKEAQNPNQIKSNQK